MAVSATDRGALRVLVVSARGPTPVGKGDQLRAYQFVQALARRHDVEVVTTAAGTDDLQALEDVRRIASVRVVRVSTAARAVGAVWSLLQRRPAQVGWMTPPRAWRLVRVRARSADVAIVVTVRSVCGPLECPIVLDHVDALSTNLRRRAVGPEPRVHRAVARIEAVLLARWERRLAAAAAAQVAISPVDARLLPPVPPVSVIPNSVVLPEVTPPPEPRDIDVILTGNMAYPPNADAARWLSEELAPRVWRRRPETTIWVVGRRAGTLRLDPRIEIRSDVPDLSAFLARARIAIAPLRIGTGSPNKVLEAMAAGAAVVATPSAVEPFGFTGGVLSVPSGDAFANAVVGLLADERRRSALVREAGVLVRRYSSVSQEDSLDRVLVAVTGGPDEAAVRAGAEAA